MLQGQGWHFTASSPPYPTLRATLSSNTVAKIKLKPVRVFCRVLLEEGVLCWLCVLIMVLVVISLICREGWEESVRTEELKLLEEENLGKKSFPGVENPFLLLLVWDVGRSRTCTILRTKGAVQLFLGMGRAPPVPRPHRPLEFCPPCHSWRVFELWMFSKLLQWQPGCPKGNTGSCSAVIDMRSLQGTTARRDAAQEEKEV